MKDDVILVNEEYRQTAEKIVALILKEIQAATRRYIVAVAGESGSGKSVTAQTLGHVLEQQQIRCVILQLDDYYILPAQSNDQKRRDDPTWRGTVEVNLDLLDTHLQAIHEGVTQLTKPLSIYKENRFDEETIELTNIYVVIVEGTYTMLLKHADKKIFIERTYLDTREARMRRARDSKELETFTESVLAIEHEVVASHQGYADIRVTRHYDVVEKAEGA